MHVNNLRKKYKIRIIAFYRDNLEHKILDSYLSLFKTNYIKMRILNFAAYLFKGRFSIIIIYNLNVCQKIISPLIILWILCFFKCFSKNFLFKIQIEANFLLIWKICFEPNQRVFFNRKI